MIATSGHYVIRPSTVGVVSNQIINLAATCTASPQLPDIPPGWEAFPAIPTFQQWLSSQPRWFKRQHRTGAQQAKLRESLKGRGWFVSSESTPKSFDKAG